MTFPDEFVVETVVSSNEIISDDPQANTRPFGESLAVVAKSTKTHLSTYAIIVILVGIVVIIFIVVSMEDLGLSVQLDVWMLEYTFS